MVEATKRVGLMHKILFVCLGNICRSPLAEGVFKKIVYDKGLTHQYKADSCGIADYHRGEPPDYRAIATARQHGIELNHAARQFEKNDFEKFDLILVMDRDNYQNAKKLSSSSNKNKIKFLRDYEFPLVFEAEVPDPYYGGQSGFEEVYQMVYKCCENLIEDLENKTNMQ